jgi:hypothetical protein
MAVVGDRVHVDKICQLDQTFPKLSENCVRSHVPSLLIKGYHHKLMNPKKRATTTLHDGSMGSMLMEYVR